MHKRFYFGQTPCNESCAQVGEPGYDVRGRAEADAHVAQLYRYLETKGRTRGELPAGFELCVSEEPHDFGRYFEVVACFPDGPGEEACWTLLRLLEASAPDEWDEVARVELGL